jgi:hypothetical protein
LRVGLIGAGHAAPLAARFALPPEVAIPDRLYGAGRPHIVHIVTSPASHYGGMLPLIQAHRATIEAGTPLPAPLSRRLRPSGSSGATWPRVDATAAAGGAGNR